VDQNSRHFEMMYIIGDPFLPTHFARFSTPCFVPKIQAVTVAVKLRSRRKSLCFGQSAGFEGNRIPQISDMHFQITLKTSEHVAGFGSVPFSELRGSRAKKEEEDRR